MNVLITGALGFIGHHLARKLLKEGHEVIGLDNCDDYYDPRIKLACAYALDSYAAWTLHYGDIRDKDLVRSIVKTHNPTNIVHLAARPGVRPSLSRPAYYADVNVVGTASLLEAIGNLPLVFASSSSVYGQTSWACLEQQPTDHPISPYAATKKAGEVLCFAHSVAAGAPVTVFRFFTVYGPGQRPEMAISKFARQLRAGEPVTLYGDGKLRRDYTYVGDTVEGIYRVLARQQPGYHVYNLGGGRPVVLVDLVQKMAEIMGVEYSIVFSPTPVGDVDWTWADAGKMERDYGWKATTDIETGLRKQLEGV